MYHILTLVIIALCAVVFERWYNSPKRLTKRIQRLCEGLIYVSETDSPVTAFCVKSFAVPAEAEVRDFDEWFATRGTDDWLILWDEMRDHLSDRAVYKVSVIHRTIYAVGNYRGSVVGVSMKATET